MSRFVSSGQELTSVDIKNCEFLNCPFHSFDIVPLLLNADTLKEEAKLDFKRRQKSRERRKGRRNNAHVLRIFVTNKHLFGYLNTHHRSGQFRQQIQKVGLIIEKKQFKKEANTARNDKEKI